MVLIELPLSDVVPPVFVVTLVSTVVAPTVPPKVVVPPVLIVRAYAPLTVPPNVIAPLDELVSVVAAPRVTAPV